MSDKFSIQSQGLLNIDLSPARMVLCNWAGDIETTFEVIPHSVSETSFEAEVKGQKESSCFGNTLIDAWEYLYYIGAHTQDCVSYELRKGLDKPLNEITNPSDIPFCTDITGPSGDMCAGYSFDIRKGTETGKPARFYRCIQYYSIPGTPKDGGSEKTIREEIYKWGPVTTGFQVFSDFYTFDPKTSIYKWDKKSPLIGGHAIEIVGWGEEVNRLSSQTESESIKKIKYWWIKNSWGEEWGIKGYFKMIRGENNCQIEENVMSGTPDFFQGKKNIIWSNYKMEDKYVRLRQLVDRGGVGIVGGGIDPYTGYTNRVQTKYPELKREPPIYPAQLPNFSTFIAGKVTPKLTQYGITQVKNLEENSTYEKLKLILFVISGVLIFVMIFFLFTRLNKA